MGNAFTQKSKSISVNKFPKINAVLKQRERDANQIFLSKAILSFLGEQGSSNRWKVIKIIRKMSRAQICPGTLCRVIRKIV